MICHLLSLGPRSPLELPRSWKVQRSWRPFPARRAAGDSSPPLQERKRGEDSSGPARTGSPRPPNPLGQTTSVRLGRFPVPSPVQRKPRAGPAFPGPGSRLPLLRLSRRYPRGEASGIWPTAAKRGMRGSRGSSRGSDIPSLLSPTGDEPDAPGSRGRPGGFRDAARQGMGINDPRVLKAPARWFYCAVKTSRKVAIRL